MVFAGGRWEVRYVWLLFEVLEGEHEELELAFSEHGHVGDWIGLI